MEAGGYDGPKGRWLRANCNGTDARASAHRRFEEHACDAHGTHAPIDLMRARPWLYVPYRGARSYRVLPLDFVRGGTYWLHEEGDSTILRGEKEDLAWLLYGANHTALHSEPVICIYAGQGAERATFKRDGCGSSPRSVGYRKTCARTREPPAPPHVYPTLTHAQRTVASSRARRSHGMLMDAVPRPPLTAHRSPLTAHPNPRRYVFSAPLWDEDNLSLELRLDFSDDRGLCDCKASNATILFQVRS